VGEDKVKLLEGKVHCPTCKGMGYLDSKDYVTNEYISGDDPSVDPYLMAQLGPIKNILAAIEALTNKKHTVESSPLDGTVIAKWSDEQMAKFDAERAKLIGTLKGLVDKL